MGTTRKRTANKVIVQKFDSANSYVFADTLRENSLGIKISVIEGADIKKVNNLIPHNESDLKCFKGTIMVHQVTRDIYHLN